jgi:hypothetical protein
MFVLIVSGGKVKAIGTEMPHDSYGSPEVRMKFRFRIEDGQHEGKEFSHCFKLIWGDETLQTNDQSFCSDIRNATGVLEPQETSDFHDKVALAVVGKMGRI